MSHLGTMISALIDGELAGAELDRANAHLAGCDVCRTEAAQLRRLKRELSALGDFGAADDAVTRRLLAMTLQGGPVTARPLSRQPGRRARRRRGRYVMWGAMSIVVVGVGAAAFGMGGSSSGSNEPQITPQLEVFDLQHAITSGDAPFAVPSPSSTRLPTPPKASKRTSPRASLRASAEATRP
jgi:anti-sigma factor RsiW